LIAPLPLLKHNRDCAHICFKKNKKSVLEFSPYLLILDFKYLQMCHVTAIVVQMSHVTAIVVQIYHVTAIVVQICHVTVIVVKYEHNLCCVLIRGGGLSII
jgi:hypothetical protein